MRGKFVFPFECAFACWQPATRRGYCWKTVDGTRQLVQVDGAAFQKYQPLKQFTGLFITFSNTEPTEAGVLKFANRFGSIRRTVGDAGPAIEGARGTGLDMWQVEIGHMKRCVTVWNALREEDWRTLHRELAGSSRQADLIDRAISTINLMRFVYESSILRSYNRETGQWAGIHAWDRQTKRPVLTLSFVDLLDAMRFQFALAVYNAKDFQACKACGSWFEINAGLGREKGTDAGRAGKTLCSESCRIKFFRQRQALAQELHAKGWTLRQIARQLAKDGSRADVETIKTWLAQNKDKE